LIPNIADLEPPRLRLIDNSEGQLFCQFIERHHYLGYRVPFGANLRYFVESRDSRILAALQWTSPAWKMTAGMINGSVGTRNDAPAICSTSSTTAAF